MCLRAVPAQDQFARVGDIEQRAGALVEHVGIDASRPQHRDAAFPIRMFGLERGEFAAELTDLLVDAAVTLAWAAFAGLAGATILRERLATLLPHR